MLSYEAAYRDAPLIDTAAVLVAPTVIEFGTDAQRRRFVRDAVAGTVQRVHRVHRGGRGLRPVERRHDRTRRRRRGYVLDGEKVLVTGAHKADWCCTIARTEPASHGAARACRCSCSRCARPASTVERVPTANGWTLGTIRFEGAEVPADTLLGTRDEGWRQLTAALLGERSGSGLAGLGGAERRGAARCVRAGAPTTRCATRSPTSRPACSSATALAERVIRAQDEGGAPFVEGAMSKVWTTELLQRIARVGAAVARARGAAASRAGSATSALAPWFAYETVERLHPTLSVGANEVQRTTIGDAGLGLPREPR